MDEIEKEIKELCPLVLKESQELSESEKKLLSALLAKTVLFVNKANIVPRPDVFFKWFLAHCYLYGKGIKNPSSEALFNAYDHVDEKLERLDRHFFLSAKSVAEKNIDVIGLAVAELEKLIQAVSRVVEEARRKIENAVKELLEKDQLTPEEIKSFHETLVEIKAKITRDIELIIKRLKFLEGKVDEVKKEVCLEPVECMKLSVFKAIVRKLIDRCANTGVSFSFILAKINKWDEWKHIPEDVKVGYIDKVCAAFKAELRGTDYVTCIKEEGLFAVVLRGVGIKTAMRVVQRLQPVLAKVIHSVQGFSLSSNFSFALVEGRSTDTFGRLMERGKHILSLCPLDDSGICIRSEVDLVGKTGE